MGEKRTAYKVLGNRHLEDLFFIIFIERNSEGNMRGTYLELKMYYYILLYWTNAPCFAATLINEQLKLDTELKKINKYPQEPDSFTNFLYQFL